MKNPLPRRPAPAFEVGDRVRLLASLAEYLPSRSPHRSLFVVVSVESDPRWVVVRVVSPKAPATLWPTSQLRKVTR